MLDESSTRKSQAVVGQRAGAQLSANPGSSHRSAWQVRAPHAAKSDRRPGMFAATCWAAIAFVGPQIALGMIMGIAGIDFADNTSIFAIQTVTQLVSVAVVAWILRRYNLTLRDLGLGRFKPKYIPYALLLLPIYIMLSGVFVYAVGNALGVNLEQEQDLGGTGSPVGIDLVFAFIALVLAAPFVEEVLFRGMLFRAYASRLGVVRGAVLVSIIFGLAHAQWNIGLDVFVLSLVLCWVRHKTGSLWPAIILHGLKNLVAFTLLFLQ